MDRSIEEHVREVRLKVARNNLPPIQNQINLISSEKDIVPGVCANAAPGHTRGHMALAISSGNDQLLCFADSILHLIHVEQPDWHAVVDLSPRQVTSTRRQLLKRAMEEKDLVFAFHFPFPGLGHVIQRGGRWRWQPI